jgi:hypothetical protein
MPEKPSPPENYFQFEKLLVELARHNVDFAVVGGVAVSLNGFVRATDDVDILVHEAPTMCADCWIACHSGERGGRAN